MRRSDQSITGSALSVQGERHVAVALACQPLVAALIGFCAYPVVAYTGFMVGGRAADPLDAALSFGLAIGMLAVLVTILGAFPALLWLLQSGPVTWRHALISGALLGNVPGVLIVAALAGRRVAQGALPTLVDLTYGPIGAIRAIAIASVIGAGAATGFWWMAGAHIVRAGREANDENPGARGEVRFSSTSGPQ